MMEVLAIIAGADNGVRGPSNKVDAETGRQTNRKSPEAGSRSWSAAPDTCYGLVPLGGLDHLGATIMKANSIALALGLMVISATAVAAKGMCACCENMPEGRRMECCDEQRRPEHGRAPAPAQDHSQHQPAPAPAQPQTPR